MPEGSGWAGAWGPGGRVGSARAARAWSHEGIAGVEAIHRGWDQPALFRVADEDVTLIAALLAAGYRRDTPTAIMAAPVAGLADGPVFPETTLAMWPPLAIMRAIWTAGGIGAARQAVMDRVASPKVAILARSGDRPAGAAFAAAADGAAMVHAVHVLPPFRRQGLAARMIRQAALWAEDHGAARLGLAVGRANAGGRAAWERVGLVEVAGHAYYRRET